MSVVDHFTKYAWTRALKSKSGDDTRQAMKSILDSVSLYPKRIQTDNGKEFSTSFSVLLKTYKISHTKSYSYAPESQGGVERFNRTIKSKNIWIY